MSSLSLRTGPSFALARLALPVAMPRLVRVVLPLWVSLVMATLFLMTAIDWHGLSAALAAQTPGPLAAVVIATWSLTTRRSFLPVLAARPLAALVRQPVSPLTWSLVLLPVLVGASLPVALVPLLAGRAWEIPAWLLAGGLGIVAASPRGAVGFFGALAAGALAGGVAGLPAGVDLAAALVGYLLLAGRLWFRALRGGSLLQPAIPGRPSSPLVALLRMDLLAPLRRMPGVLLASYLGAALPLAWLAAAMLGGGLPLGARPIAVAVVTGLACAVPLAALGESYSLRELLDPAWWPVSPWQRSQSLVLSSFLLCLPLVLVVGVLTASVADLLRSALLALSMAAAGALVGVWQPKRAFNIGSLAGMAAVAVVPAQAAWPWPLLDLLLGVGALLLLRRRLAHRRGIA